MPPQCNLRVGLTGGIGSGKTTVAGIFEQRFSIPVIDADQVVRRLTEPGQAVYDAVVAAFGQKILNPQQSLDRAKLRELVFSDVQARLKLECIIHPQVRAELKAWLKRQHAPYCIIVIPLLIESGMHDMLDRILVVDCDAELQIRRSMMRDRLSREQVEQIMRAQLAREERLAYADEVIDNSLDLEHLQQQVAAVDARYRRLAQK